MLKYIDVVEKAHTIIIDAYSTKKSIKASVLEIAKEVEKYSTTEAAFIRNNLDEVLSCDNYINVTSVGCACNCDISNIEYSDANYYITIQFIKD